MYLRPILFAIYFSSATAFANLPTFHPCHEEDNKPLSWIHCKTVDPKANTKVLKLDACIYKESVDHLRENAVAKVRTLDSKLTYSNFRTFYQEKENVFKAGHLFADFADPYNNYIVYKLNLTIGNESLEVKSHGYDYGNQEEAYQLFCQKM